MALGINRSINPLQLHVVNNQQGRYCCGHDNVIAGSIAAIATAVLETEF